MHTAEFHRILLPSRNHAVCSWLEVLRRVEIGDKAGLPRLPAQQLSRSLTRRRAIHPREMREPAKVLSSLLGRFADDRNVHTTADRLSDLSKRHALLGDSVISGSRRGGAPPASGSRRRRRISRDLGFQAVELLTRYLLKEHKLTVCSVRALAYQVDALFSLSLLGCAIRDSEADRQLSELV